MSNMRPIVIALALVAGALSACATKSRPPAERPNALTGAVEQPLKDLSIVREKIPPVLAEAAEAPYVETQPLDCPRLMAELDELDRQLGPDLDAANPGSDLISDALRSALGLPFRGVVRKVTGAEKRDKEKAKAIISGIARRGFLKGVTRHRCEGPDAQPAARPPVAAPVIAPSGAPPVPPPIAPVGPAPATQ